MKKYINIHTIAPILLVIAITCLYPVADPKDTRYSAYFRFAACAYVLALVMVWHVNKWVCAFMLLAGLSSFHPFSTAYSKSALLAVGLGGVWYLCIAKIPLPHHVHLLNAICIIALCNVLLLISQGLGYDPIFMPKSPGSVPPVGLLSNRNEVSALLAFCLPAFFRAKWKYAMPLVILGLFIARSTGGVLAAVLGSVLYVFLIYRRGMLRKYWLVCAVLAIAVLGFLWKVDPIVSKSASGPLSVTTALTSRATVWGASFKIIKHRWIFGSGIGHWKAVWKNIKTPEGWWRHAHNEYVQSFFEMGIISIVFIVGYFISAIRSYRKDLVLPFVALIIIAMNSIVNFPFHIAQTAVVALTWMGMLAAQKPKAAQP